MSGRQGAGGFSITFNAIMDDIVIKRESSDSRTYRGR
jgi:hypothetical protein